MTFRLIHRDHLERMESSWNFHRVFIVMIKTISNFIFSLVQQGKPTSTNSDDAHPGVTCDGCDIAVVGYRYKCLECHDYDLCSPCHNKGAHADHDMVCIRKPKVPRIRIFRFPQKRFRMQCATGVGDSKKCRREDGKESESHSGDASNPCEEMMTNVASAFGLDPEVALSTAKLWSMI